MAEKRAAQSIPIQERASAFESPAKKHIDRAAGVIREVTIFAPKMKGKYLWSANRAYHPDFLDNAIPILEGAMALPRHDKLGRGNTDAEEQSPFDGKGVHENLRRVGNKLVSDFVPFKECAEDVFDRVEKSWKNIAFSISGEGTGFYDGATPVATHLQEFPRPTIDFVRNGGAVLHLLESAPNKEGSTMTPEEMQKITDDAALKAAELNTLDPEKMKAELLLQVRESLKGELEAGKEAAKQIDAMKAAQEKEAKALKIREALVNSKLEDRFIDSALRMALEAAPEDKWEGIIKERRTLVGSFHNPVTGNGGERNDGAPDIRVGRQGLHITIREMAGKNGFEQDRASAQAFTRQWNDRIGNAISDFYDTSAETRKLRMQVIESWQRSGLKNLFGYCYGENPLDRNHLNQLMRVREVTPIDDSGFTAINQTIIAAIMIERYMISDRTFDELVTPYPTSKEIENIQGFTAAAGAGSFLEGAAPPDVTITPKYVTLQKLTKKYGGVVSLTREAVLYDQTGQLMEHANAFVDDVALKRQQAIGYGIVDYITATAAGTGNDTYRCYYPSGSVASLWNGTNTEETNALANWLDVDQAYQRLGRQLNENSKRIMDNTTKPLEVLIPWSLRSIARRVFGAEFNETRESTYSQVTHFPNEYSGTKVIVSNILDVIDQSSWYVAGAGGFKKQYLNKETIKFEIVPLPPTEIQGTLKDLVAGVKCEFLEKTQARDNKRVIRNIIGGAS